MPCHPHHKPSTETSSSLRLSHNVKDQPKPHTYPDMAWEPKAAFTALADRYRG
jgi:hypothetical protein